MSTAIAVAVNVTIVTALALLACRLLRRRSAAVRHMMLAASLAAGTAAPIFEIAAPPWRFPVLSATSPVTTFGVGPSSALTDAGEATVPQMPETAGLTWTEAIVTVWALGFVVVTGSLLIGLGRLAEKTRRCRPVRSGIWREQADAVSRQYDGARRVAVLESQERVLLTWGFFRPRIIVPAEAASWTAERIAIVLAHEFAHIARRDWALAIAAQMVCAVHWFNPLIWMTCRRLRDESEQACDDSVLRRGVNAADYASHLVAVARHLLAGGGGWTAATAVASPSTLERRIASMLNASHDRRPATRVVRAVAVVTMLAVAATVASVTLTEPFAPALSARSPRYDVRLPAPPALPVVSAPDTRRDVARSDSRTRAEPTQQIPASVSGVVRDASGAVMPGVDLTMTDKSAGTSRSIATDSNGRFVFRNLQPSRYELSARLPGFASTVLDLTLAGGQDLQRDVVMRIGGITESISVVCPAGAAAVPRGAADGTILAGLDAATTRLFAIWRSMDVMPTLAAQAPVRVGGQLTAPQKTTHVAPRCPDSSPPAGGLVVVLETVIGVDGRVQNIRSLRPPLSGDVVVQSVRSQNGTWEIRSMRPVAAGSQAEFVIAAMEAVVQWVYTPTRLNNDPTAVIMTATVTFSPPK